MSNDNPTYLMFRPNWGAIRETAGRFPGVDIGAVETVIKIMSASNQLLANCDAFFARHKTSRGRFLIMCQLMQEPDGLTPGELAERGEVTRATMTGLIDTLEQNGFIERRDSPDDRRMYRVIITEKGRAFMDELLPVHFRRSAVLMAGLSADEREQLVGLLHKVELGIAVLETNPSASASKA